MATTTFRPDPHGFRFSNNDITWTFGGISGKALCGGMAYAALDYFYVRRSIPSGQPAEAGYKYPERPPSEQTALHNFILNRQKQAHLNTGLKFFGSWMKVLSIDGAAEFTKLKAILQTGKPIPLCMVHETGGHHLVAYACNDSPPITIFVYDPNMPNKPGVVIQPSPTTFTNTLSSRKFRTIFVDDAYVKESPPVIAIGRGWKRCHKCQEVFFVPKGGGVCPKSGGHAVASTKGYLLPIGGGGQQNWRWCSKCNALYFAGDASNPGVCPSGGIHNGIDSPNYSVPVTTAAHREANWRWCRVCEALFYAGAGSLGACPKNPNGHDGSKSIGFYMQEEVMTIAAPDYWAY